jgi:23S rRNA pseudouridine1911/1915/1917 synthase
MTDLLLDEDEAVAVIAEGVAPSQTFIVEPEQAGARIDVFLASVLPDVSRAQVRRLVDDGAVLCNGKPAKPSLKVLSGDTVSVTFAPARESHIAPESIPLDVVFEDDDVLIVNKARGMVVHPGVGSESGTLVNALLAHGTEWSGVGGVARPGIVHRLDKDTTGLLMVAKTDFAHHTLQGQIQERKAKRLYQALVWGRCHFEEAVIDLPIGRHPGDRTRMAVIEPASRLPAREAVTDAKVTERLGKNAIFTLLECSLQTGRTHQIRVHLSYAGYPVVGDPQYGGMRKVSQEAATGSRAVQLMQAIENLHGQALHAYSLSFNHPRTGERLTFTAPLPPEFAALLELLRAIGKE